MFGLARFPVKRGVRFRHFTKNKGFAPASDHSLAIRLMSNTSKSGGMSKTNFDMVPAALQQDAMDCVARFVELGNAAWYRPGINREKMGVPTLSFDLRGRVAGRAISQKSKERFTGHIQLNAELLLRETQEILQDTVPHEVAHLLAHYYFGRVKAHGHEWQRVMRSLGRLPKRTHSMQTTPARVVKAEYVYECRCRRRNLTAIRHKRVYSCEVCGETLRFVSGPPGARETSGSEKLLSMLAARAAGSSTPRAFTASLPSPPVATPKAPPVRPFVAWGLPPSSPATPPAPATRTAPTEKQLAFATSLSTRNGVAIPADARESRLLLSRWIDSQLKSQKPSGR